MLPLTAGELAAMKTTQESSLSDLCDIHTPTITEDSYGYDEEAWTTEYNVPCGFMHLLRGQSSVSTYTQEIGTIKVIESDALLRLPLTQEINELNEVTVRGVRYTVDGVDIGRTITRVGLKEFKPSVE